AGTDNQISYNLADEINVESMTATDPTTGNTTVVDGNGSTMTDAAGNTNVSTANGDTLTDAAGNTNVSTANGNTLTDVASGATTTSTAGSTTLDDGAGNVTVADTTGTTVTDAAGNTASYGATGASVTDSAGNTTTVTGNSVSVGGTNPITISGDTGTIGGLTNTTWTAGQTPVTGQAATEDQLSNLEGNLTDTGFNIRADGDTTSDDNVKLGETVDYTNDDDNIEISVTDNEVNYELADDINVESMTATDPATGNTTVVDGNGSSMTDAVSGNTNISTANGDTLTDATSGATTTSTAGSTTLDDGAGNVTVADTTGTTVTDATGNTASYGATGASVTDSAGNTTTVTGNSVSVGGTNPITISGDTGEITGLSNTSVDSADFGTAGRVATEEQLQQAINDNITQVEDGEGNTLNIINQIVNQNPDDSNQDSLFLTYDVEGQEVTDRLTIGQTVQKMNTDGIKFFHTNASTNETGDLGVTNDSSAGAENSTAIGVNAIVSESGVSGLAVGHDTLVEGAQGIAIGNGAQALGEQSISIGTGNVVNGNRSGAIGDPSIINGDDSYSVGNNNTIDSNDTFVLGNDVTQTTEGSVVLGTGSGATTGAGEVGYVMPNASAADSAAVAATTSTTGAVAVGNAEEGVYRQITGVAAGTQDADAVNVSQLKAVANQVNQSIDQLDGSAVKYDENPDGTVNKGNITLDGADGTTISNLKAGDIAEGSTDAVNGDQIHDIVGAGAFDADGNLSNIGSTGQSNINDAIASINQSATAAKTEVEAGQNMSVTSETGADGQTVYTVATADDVTFDSVSSDTVTAGQVQADVVTVGDVTINADGIDAGNKAITNVGNGSVAEGSTDAVNGGQLNATNQAVVQYLGGGAGYDNITNSFAAPSYQVGEQNYDNVGGAIDALNAADVALDNRVSALGDRLENAFYQTNKRIDEVEKDARAGIASSMAMQNAPFVAGKYTYAVGAAHHGGEQAVGATLRKTADNGRWSLTGGVATATQGDPSFRIGISGVID
ncbi:MAG: YadA-like family protein, partial [Pseudomonadota bacterium]|nr:YadA-like family protein [Pseudomonadota bacterium]